METHSQLIYSGSKPYQLFFKDRGYDLKSGEKTPRLPYYECIRLLKTGNFTADDGTWNNIIKSHDYSDYSEIDGLLKGQRVFLIGGGSSLKDVDLSLLDDEFTIATNHAGKNYPKSKACLFVDSAFAKNEKQWLITYTGMVFASYKCVDYLPRRKNTFLFPINSRRPGQSFGEGLYSGRLSGLAAINLALLLGAVEIYLLGYDMKSNPDECPYWYDAPSKGHTGYSETHFSKKIPMFGVYAHWRDMIFNCSLDSGIEIFKKVDLNRILDQPPKTRIKTFDFRERIHKANIRKSRRKNKIMPPEQPAGTYALSSPEKLKRVNGMLENKRVFVLGSGSSLKNFNLNRLNKEETIAVNHTLEFYNKAKHHLFGDPRVLGYVTEIYKSYKGNIFASWHANLGTYERQNDNVYVFAKKADRPSEKIEDGLYSDFNSGMEAVNLALIMGAKEIYLLGFDFCAHNGEYYFYGKPKWMVNTVEQVDKLLSSRVAHWEQFKPYKDRIFNCSPVSMIKTFEYRDIEEVLNEK